jgi:glutamate/tyrosine decarboxylase-like PLP-dependent enzyme
LVEPFASALNPSCAGGDHAGVLLERTATRWLAELIGFPYQPGGGLLTSGASMATVVALAAARQRAAQKSGWDPREEGLWGRPPMVLYVSGEGHSCLRKAAELLGIGHRQVRAVSVDRKFRLDPLALREAIADDRAAGRRPFCVAASAGTVNTGAIDPLSEVADIATDEGLWFHVDGAYGGLGVVDPRLAAAYSGLERADSVVLDPHKWLGVPVDCGCVLLADPTAARDAFSLVPAYLRSADADGLGWLSEYGPELTRPFRALRVWATVSHLGRLGIEALVTRTVDTARSCAALVDADDDLELLAPVATSIVAFRWKSGERLDDVNRGIPAIVQRRGRAFITGTRLGDVEALRACFINPATTVGDVAVLLDEIHTAARSLTDD